MDPFTGRVFSFEWEDLVLKIVNLIELHKALRQPGSAFKPFVYALSSRK